MRFSLVVPYRDRAAYLPRTLRSIARQSYRPIEVLLVDNGSTDNGAAICRDFATEHDAPDFRVRLLAMPDGGACKARNLGLEEAAGEYVYFFDSDDEMEADFLGDVAAVLDAAPPTRRPDMVAARTRMVMPDGSHKVRTAYANGSVRDQVLTGMLATQAFVASRSLLRAVGGWNERLPKWNDWELGIRLLQARPHIVWLTRAYHYIYQHADSLTGASLADTYPQIRPALDAATRLTASEPAARRALNFRKTALAATLRRAGHAAEARRLRREARQDRRDPLLGLLYLYDLLPFSRGSWWLFRMLAGR